MERFTSTCERTTELTVAIHWFCLAQYTAAQTLRWPDNVTHVFMLQ